MANATALKEAKERLSRIGKTYDDLAQELGVSTVVVKNVLNGRHQGLRGDPHKVAVTLGLKEGVIVPPDMSIIDALKVVAVK